MSDPARTYRQLAGQGASLVNLVVQSYDQILNSLYAAVRAIEARRIEDKTRNLNHALLLVGHLQNALDFNAGPQIARNLERFYNLARTRIITASARNSASLIQEVAQDFLSMREAWEQVEKDVATAAKVLGPAAQPNPYSSIPPPSSGEPIDWTA